jgi:hypothetical protein
MEILVKRCRGRILRWIPARCNQMVGHPSATFLRNLDSTPNPEFEKVMEGCAVIQALTVS